MSNMTPQVQFFYDNAGYSYGVKETQEVGHIRCARLLARAEDYARDSCYYLTWEPDECIGCGCGETEQCPCCCGDSHMCECALLHDKDGSVIAALGSICNADGTYRRVIAAELTLEAMLDHAVNFSSRNNSQ
jgi:hypothetical protein